MTCICLSYYYLIKTTQLQFDWYYLERKIKKRDLFLCYFDNSFLLINSAYFYFLRVFFPLIFSISDNIQNP